VSVREFNKARPRYNRAASRVLLALILGAAVGNLAFFLAYGRQTGKPLLTPLQAHGAGLILATPVGAARVLAANDANQLLLFAGDRLTKRTQLAALIGGVAASPDGKTVYAGTSDGAVTVLDANLAKHRSFQVNGRVVGLKVTGGGGLLVAYGLGAFSDRYYVGFYPNPRAGNRAAFTTQVGFTITALDVLKANAVYGLLNAQVGVVDAGAGGKIAWQTTLTNPATRVLGVPQRNRVLAGDKTGALTWLDDHGHTLGQVQLGQYPIHALVFDQASGDYFAGDANGRVFALDKTMKVVLSRDVAVSGNGIEALIPNGPGSLVIVPGDGPWLDLNAAALGGVEQAARVGTTWLEFDGVMLVAILVALVFVVRRLRAVARAAWRARLAYAFVVPAIALIGVFTYYPAIAAVYYSLTDFSLRNVTQFVGLQNYQQIITSDFYFRTGLVNMALIVITSMIKAVTVPLLVAELIFWLRNKTHQYVFRTLFVLPAVVPGLVFTLLWKQVYDPRTGLLNQLLAVVGLLQLQRAWLGDAGTALWAVIGVGFPYVDAFAFLILLGGLLNINGEFFDAAKVDGASWWSRFRHIDLPLLVSQFRILLFFAITGTVQGFAAIFILTQGGPGTATYVPALQMYLRISNGDFGYASAIGVVLFAMILVATLFILRFRRQDAVEIA